MTGRELLESIPEATVALRAAKSLTATDVADVTDEELERGARWFRACAYNAEESARTLDLIRRTRSAG